MREKIGFISSKFIAIVVLLFILCLYQIDKTKPKSRDDVMQAKVYDPTPPKWKYSKNARPEHFAKKNIEDAKQLYVVILDQSEKPDDFQCIEKKQWIDPFLESGIVDNVEIYSVTSWKNDKCNLSTLVVPKTPYQTLNPSSWLLMNSMKMFKERSKAGWVLIIGDAAHINTQDFLEMFQTIAENTNGYNLPKMNGGCVELRYFFQMLMIESGIIISRKTIDQYLDENVKLNWRVVSETGINADESLSQLGDEIGFYIKSLTTDQLLGRDWRNNQSYEQLLNKDFERLPPCVIPYHYINNQPGDVGICSTTILPVNKILIWASPNQDKKWFLENAEKMLSDNPSNIKFYWDRSQPMLCKN